jgi:hypothetical protein
VGFRFALIMHAHGHMTVDSAPHLAGVTVQVWDDNKHVGDIDMATSEYLAPIGLDINAPIEQWAARLGRAMAGVLEENFQTCVKTNTLHYHENFEMVTQVTPDQK